MKNFRFARLFKEIPVLTVCAGISIGFYSPQSLAWAPKQAPLMTRWSSEVKPDKVLPEYPRPQLVRQEWQNLNGVWQFQPGAEGEAAPIGQKLSSEILVPFAVESALSGVMEHHDRLWYRRTFTIPAAWKSQKVKLNFGAVDYEAQVFVNGQSIGTHKGGYLPFSYDITPALKKSGPQELIVRVFDPTENEGQPRGKQTTTPKGIMYTPTTGIWQTVWLEPVSPVSIAGLAITPDIDNQKVNIQVNTSAQGTDSPTRVAIKVLDGKRVVTTQEGAPNATLSLPIPNPKLWSPNAPFLYDLNISLMQGKRVVDRVTSYFGMRKISLGDEGGVKKLFLNNAPLFQMGPLDQGFWPDGLYTAPTDAALRFDIETEKTLGFNMVRKHIKVEPARWYYWTDKLGLLVWQDMPSANSYYNENKIKPPLDKPEYGKELREMVETLRNVPSIVMWIVFNEGQGRHETPALVEMVKKLDPSRLANRDSGGTFDKGSEDVGDVDDIHSYPPPATPQPSATQALVCGEYGGIGYLLKGHAWRGDGWGYTSVASPGDLEFTYAEFMELINKFRQQNGLSGAIYTQITDVEGEINGLMSYDRVLKPDATQIALANRFAYPVPTYTSLVPTSEGAAQTWKYTTSKPADNWNQKGFDDTMWQQGSGGFGTNVPGAPRVGTPWTTPDLWLRRTFNPGALTAEQMARLVFRDYHDENVEVFINGVLAYSARGHISTYENKPFRPEAKNAIVPNAENLLAVHCSQTGGGQYVDVGIYDRQMPKPQ